MRTALALFLIIFGLYSCLPGEQETTGRHRQQLDSLLTELSSMNQKLNSLNIAEIQRVHDSLSAYYDTAEVVDTVEARRQKWRQSRNILDWYDNIDREITFSRSHLRALQRQSGNKRMDTIAIQELQKEKQIVSNLRERFDEEYRGLQRAIRKLLDK
jgi:hypothetical protein